MTNESTLLSAWRLEASLGTAGDSGRTVSGGASAPRFGGGVGAGIRTTVSLPNRRKQTSKACSSPPPRKTAAGGFYVAHLQKEKLWALAAESSAAKNTIQ